MSPSIFLILGFYQGLAIGTFPIGCIYGFDAATDDCGLLEAHGFNIKLCDVGKDNIKITEKADIAAARAILKKRSEAEECE